MKLSRFIFLLVLLLPVTVNLTAAYAIADTTVKTEEFAKYPGMKTVNINAASAILADAQTGEILYAKNIHERRAPASLTKILTCLLVLEKGNLDDVVTAKATAYEDLSNDGSTQNIKEGEQMTVRDLLYCTMVASANEACNILAEYISGSVSAFVDLMNQRAKEIGCLETNFANTTGLPNDSHYSSAHDLYLISMEAMRNPAFVEIAHTDSYSVAPTNLKPEGRTLNTTNYLISRKPSANTTKYAYAYAKGIKTGHTNAAGYCLASSAEKNNIALISVVLGAEKDADTDTIHSFVDTKNLFEWGFNNFSYRRILNKSEIKAEIPVWQGVGKDAITLVPETEITVLLPNNLKNEDIQADIDLTEPNGIFAPVEKGLPLGTITLSYGDHNYGSSALLASFTIELSATENIMGKFDSFINQWWIKWALLGVILLIILYIIFTISYNVNRHKNKNQLRKTYKGRKRRRR